VRIVNCGRVVWAIDSFAPCKDPEMDGIFLALLQERWEVLVPSLTWSGSFVPIWQLATFQAYGAWLR